LGKAASSTKRKKAVKYAKNQVGEGFKLKTSLFTSKKWYCSKLVFRAWNSVGYDLRGVRGTFLAGYVLILPNDIMIDLNTRTIKKWGKTTPGLL
jgi:uncharacterized protein YycO